MGNTQPQIIVYNENPEPTRQQMEKGLDLVVEPAQNAVPNLCFDADSLLDLKNTKVQTNQTEQINRVKVFEKIASQKVINGSPIPNLKLPLEQKKESDPQNNIVSQNINWNHNITSRLKLIQQTDLTIQEQNNEGCFGSSFFTCFRTPKRFQIKPSNPKVQEQSKLNFILLCQDLEKQDYQNKAVIEFKIKQLNSKEKENSSNSYKFYKFRYEVAKFYSFYQENAKSIEYLDLILQNKQNIRSINFTNIKMFRFMNICCLNQAQVSEYNLKSQYLALCTQIIRSVTDKKRRFQMLLFTASLLYHFVLTRTRIIQKAQQISEFNDLDFIADLVQTYSLQMSFASNQSTKVNIKLAAYLGDQIHPEFNKRTNLFRNIINDPISQGNIIVQDFGKQKKIVSIQPPQAIDIEPFFLIAKNNLTMFQEGQQTAQEKVKYETSFSFWNISILYIACQAHPTQSWIMKYKNAKCSSFQQHEWKKLASSGIGVTIFKGQNKILPQTPTLETDSHDFLLKLQSLLKFTTENACSDTLPKENQDKILKDNNKLSKSRVKNQYNSQDVQKFNRGMKNLGNTCYINSALQCLHKSKPFTQAFTIQFTQRHKSSQPNRLRLSKQYFYFIKKMWEGQRQPVDARQLKEITAQKNNLFLYNSQNDSVQFFSTFISILSQELNKSQKQRINKKIDHFSQDHQQIYDQTKRNEEKNCLSLVQQTFTGRYKVIYQCLGCTQKYTMFQKFNIHLLQIQQTQNKIIQLQRCLQLFKKEQYLKGDNQMQCEKCEKLAEQKKIMEIYEANKIIVLAIKRFYNGRKNQTFVKVPMILQTNQIMSNYNKPLYQDMCYRLYAAIIHTGSLDGGHYTAICRNYKTNKWMEYNDSHFSELKQINLSDAYALFYELIQQERKNQDNTPIAENKYPYNFFPNFETPNTFRNAVGHSRQNTNRNKRCEIRLQTLNNLDPDKQKKLKAINYVLQSILRTNYFQKQFLKQKFNLKHQKKSLSYHLYKFSELMKAKKTLTAQDCRIQLLEIHELVQEKIKNKTKKEPKVLDFIEKLLKVYNQQRQIASIPQSIDQNHTAQRIESKLKIHYSCINNKRHIFQQGRQIISLNTPKDISKFEHILKNFKEKPQAGGKYYSNCQTCKDYPSFQVKKEISTINNIMIFELKFDVKKFARNQISIPFWLQPDTTLDSKISNTSKIQLTSVISFEGDLKDGQFSVQYFEFQTSRWMQFKNNKTEEYQLTDSYNFPRAYILLYELIDKKEMKQRHSQTESIYRQK